MGVVPRSLRLQGFGENHAPTELPHIGLDCWSPNVGILQPWASLSSSARLH